MRKMTIDVYQAWKAGKARKPGSSIWTDGETVYSYNTPIMRRVKGEHIVLNVRKYSVTTTRHQNGLQELLGGIGQSPYTLTEEPSDLF